MCPLHRCTPLLARLYFIWVVPSGNDFEVSSTHHPYVATHMTITTHTLTHHPHTSPLHTHTLTHHPYTPHPHTLPLHTHTLTHHPYTPTPSQWFTDYLSELCEDEHVHRYLDVRVFLTNINSPPDELASALLQLGIKTAGPHCIVRRPSQPQLNNLHSKTSYGVPDFPALLDCMLMSCDLHVIRYITISPPQISRLRMQQCGAKGAQSLVCSHWARSIMP